MFRRLVINKVVVVGKNANNNKKLIMSTTAALSEKNMIRLSAIIIHSKYFPDSDWLKAHV